MLRIFSLLSLIYYPLLLPAQESPASGDRGVEVMLGIGSRIGGPRVTNYQPNSNVLESTNLGRATPQFLTGLGFPMCNLLLSTKSPQDPVNDPKFCNNPFYNRLSGFVSVQFSTGSSSSISGYTVGLAFHVSKYLHALAGFSLSPVSEPSPGFAIAASQYVSSHQSQYPGIDPSKLLSNAPNAFDGFQYVIPPPAGSSAAAIPIYPGNVLTTHYRGGLFIGVAFPISLKNLLQGQ